MKKRLKYIDIAKAFAIFFIVFGHTIVHSKNSDITLKFVCSFHVVLFFLLSGYTFSLKNSFTEFFKKKFKRIMIPYFIWAVAYLIPFFIFGMKTGDKLGTEQTFNMIFSIKNILYANGNNAALKQNSSLWFLPALFTMEIVYYFIIKHTNKSKKKESFMFLLLLIVGFIFSNKCHIVFPWGINTVINLGIFFYLGYILKEYKIFEEVNTRILLILSLIIGLFSCYYGNKIHISYIDFYYGNYIYMVLSGIFLSIFTICVSKLIMQSKILEYVGRNTMGILIFHKLVVIIFQTKLGYISQLIMNSNIFIETFLGIVVSIISILISLFITKIVKNIFPELLGEQRNV